MNMPYSLLAVFLATLVASSAHGADDAADFDAATGFRISRYRSPVPESVPGGTRIDADELKRLVDKDKALLIDAAPAEGAGPDPASGTWRLSKPRDDIPGSHWLPDVGRGRLSPGMERYFARNLARLTGGDKSRPIIIYCLSDCWMGWNAAKRAAGEGYRAVYWYPEGTDGWRDWDGTFARAEPVPLDPTEAAQIEPRVGAGK